MKSHSDRIVWITGASSGIGAALARAFAADGARCVLSARGAEALEATRRSCAAPDRHVILPMDVTDFDSHEGLVERVYREVGPVDVLVLNSGIGHRSSVIDTPLAIVRRVMDVNFTGAVSHARLVAARMADRGAGRIVAISSVNGRVGIPWRSAYCASKHAMHGWFESLRAELAGSGVGVTIICPGYVRTAISRNSLLADGSAYGTVAPEHAGGMDADDLAHRALRAIRRGRAEVHIGGPEKWGIQLFRFAPNLFRRIVPRYGRRPARG
jgi:short-subunit dehydrogenase